MAQRKSPAQDKLASRQGAAARGQDQSNNVGMVGLANAVDTRHRPTFVVGTVSRSGPGWLDTTVVLPNGREMGCNILANLVHGLYGVSETCLPVEGSRVLVALASSRAIYGTVIGVMPPTDTRAPLNKAGKIQPVTNISVWNMESSVSMGTEAAYKIPIEDPSVFAKVNAGAGRPLDVIPGQWLMANDQDVGITIRTATAEMRASDRAGVSVSLIDDRVQVNSGHFVHVNAAGMSQQYNDGSLVTEEAFGSPYQCERSGQLKLGQSIFESKVRTVKDLLKKSTILTWLFGKKKLIPRRRWYAFFGHLGDLFNLFIMQPDPDVDPEEPTSESKDRGTFQAHVDGSGKVILRTAQGFSLQRWDHIPVPKRLKQPWDPSGDKVEDSELPNERKPVEWPTEYPYGRSLQIRDAAAWVNYMAYKRLHDQSTQGGGKDFQLPEESEVKIPDNEYDKPGKSKEEFQKNENRQAYFNMENDGSFIIRDAWGSEIIMRGGNIIINCAGQIELRSGKSVVALAGHDLVLKARQSVDVIATEKDVRIKAESNLSMVSEGRNGKGGILIESKSKSTGADWDGKGEEVNSPQGIVLKADQSRVYTFGQIVHTSAEKQLMLETFGEGGTNDGIIQISTRFLYSSAEKGMLLTAGEGAGVIVVPSFAALVAPGTYLMGGQGAGILEGPKAWIPLAKVDTQDGYSELQPQIQQVYDQLQEVDWLQPYDPDGRKKARFTYRSSAECGTVQATEVEGGKDFQVYQAAWAYLAEAGSKLVNVTTEGWEEHELDGTYAWPGEAAYPGSGYIVMESETNIEDPVTGMPKKRSELTEKPGKLTAKPFSDYHVVKH